MFAVGDIFIYAVLSGVLTMAVLATQAWSRGGARFVMAGLATTVGFAAWNLTLNATHATGFNVDAPVVGVSWADAGSGVLAFCVTALALGLVAARDETAGRVVGAASVAGVIALLVDLFVL